MSAYLVPSFYPQYRRGLLGSFEESPRAEVRLDDMQFALSALQPRATVGPVSAVGVHSTLRRLYTVPWAPWLPPQPFLDV